MNKAVDIVKAAILAFGAALGVFLGSTDGLLITLIVFALVDYITGVISAAVRHCLSSQIGFKGIARKLFMFVLVGVGNLIDMHVLGGSAVLRSTIIFFYIANEGLSIIENAGEIGLPIPQKLKKLMEQIKEKNDHDEG